MSTQIQSVTPEATSRERLMEAKLIIHMEAVRAELGSLAGRGALTVETMTPDNHGNVRRELVFTLNEVETYRSYIHPVHGLYNPSFDARMIVANTSTRRTGFSTPSK